jgi:hypothetical protein
LWSLLVPGCGMCGITAALSSHLLHLLYFMASSTTAKRLTYSFAYFEGGLILT